jgi:ATP-binding cassette subfamily E protein 1
MAHAAFMDKNKTQEELTRIAIINKDRCKPKKCNQECKRSCPVNRVGKLCVQVEKDSVNCLISEPLCIGQLIS